MVIASESWQSLLMCLQVLMTCGVSVLTCRWDVSKTCYGCWNVILLSAVFVEWRFLMWRCIRAWWWSSVRVLCILSSLQTGSYFKVSKQRCAEKCRWGLLFSNFGGCVVCGVRWRNSVHKVQHYAFIWNSRMWMVTPGSLLWILVITGGLTPWVCRLCLETKIVFGDGFFSICCGSAPCQRRYKPSSCTSETTSAKGMVELTVGMDRSKDISLQCNHGIVHAGLVGAVPG